MYGCKMLHQIQMQKRMVFKSYRKRFAADKLGFPKGIIHIPQQTFPTKFRKPANFQEIFFLIALFSTKLRFFILGKNDVDN